MTHFFIGVSVALLLMMLLVLIRAIKGPTVIDRLVSVNVIGTKATVIMVLLGLIFKRLDMFVDIAIGYGLLNFIASIAAARFFERHRHISPERQWQSEDVA